MIDEGSGKPDQKNSYFALRCINITFPLSLQRGTQSPGATTTNLQTQLYYGSGGYTDLHYTN